MHSRFMAPDGAASTTGADAGKTGEQPAAKTGDQAAGADATKTGGDAGSGKTAEGQTGTTDEGKAGATKTGDAGKKAPEKYALTVPDDAKRLVAAQDLTFVEQIARENDWTNEEAQAELTALIARAQERVGATITAWESETKADPTYGGEKLPETQRLANLVIDRVRPKGHERRESFMAFLKNTGGGVNLEVVSFMADLGKLMAEDGGTGGRASGGEAKSNAASKLYDHPASRALDEQGAAQS